MLHICLPCLDKLNNAYNYKRLCLQNINRFNSFIHKLKSTHDTYSNLQVTLIDINIIQETWKNEHNCDFITTENSKIDNVTVQKDTNQDETKLRHKPEVVGEILAKESQEMRCINSSDVENNSVQEEIIIKEEAVPEMLDGNKKFFV